MSRLTDVLCYKNVISYGFVYGDLNEEEIKGTLVTLSKNFNFKLNQVEVTRSWLYKIGLYKSVQPCSKLNVVFIVF